MNFKKGILLSCCTFWIALSFAQSPIQWAKFGNIAFEEGDLYAAIDYFGKAYRADTTQLQNLMKLGDSYRLNNNYVMAEKSYQEVYSRPTPMLSRANYGMSAYWLARMQQSQGKYDTAGQNFERYANYEATPGSFFWKDAKQQIKSCAWAQSNIKDSTDISFNNTNFASNYTDFGGTLINDTTLLYSSLRFLKKDSTLKLAKSERSKKVQTIGARQQESNWTREPSWDTLFTETELHIGNASYFADSNWLLYSECPDYNNCKIKYRKFKDGIWSAAIELPATVNLEGFSATQPVMAIIKGKPTLFFVSNRPQGRGKLDIWYSTFEKRLNDFKYPRNMGRKVNSAGNEVTPFYSSDSNQLYFSSDWWEGYGGYDVFKVGVTNLRSTSKSQNASQPINTPTNDLYFWESPKQTIFVSSNRPGGTKMVGQTCCNDIYFAGIQPPQELIEPIPIIDTIAPSLDTLKDTLPLIVTIPELNNYLPVLYFENDQPNPGSFNTTTNEDYADLLKQFTENKNTYLSEFISVAESNESDSLKQLVNNLFNKKVKNGLTDLNRFIDLMLPELKAGKKIKVTIKGYASPLAGPTYNLKLSQRRISSIINYLNSYQEGVLKPFLSDTSTSGRIIIEQASFGESEASNTVSDNRRNKALSVYSPAAILERRIEVIKVTEEE